MTVEQRSDETTGEAVADNNLPAGNLAERALHVLVPEEAHRQARMAAVASRPRLSFKAYMAKLMLSAQPIVDRV